MTLDLIGHSTRHHHLLRLGHTSIDMLDRGLARFFHTLSEDGVLARLDVVAVRLLGCETAHQEPLTAAGFDPAFAHLLVEASALC